MKCEKCDSNLIIKETPNTIHYAKLICAKCGKWFKWLSHPDNEERRTQTSKFGISHIINFHKMKRSRCFFCLRTRSQLGTHETLTIDHIEEIDKGGKDIIENLQILCSACHKLKNWIRLYFNWHLKEENDTKTTSEETD